jgi:hypothetical protein
MDRREMKKHILYNALKEYITFDSEYQMYQRISDVLDKDREYITRAEALRFRAVLTKMWENAQDKLE